MFTLIIIFLPLLPYTETQRVLWWRIYIEEYLLTFHNMKGTDNVKYYRFSLSRLPRLESLVGDDIGTIAVKNPQTNAICERLHQSIRNSPRIMLKGHP